MTEELKTIRDVQLAQAAEINKLRLELNQRPTVKAVPETPRSWIQAVISVCWFAIFGCVCVIMTFGLIQSLIELTTYLSVIGIYGSISGTIILWLFRSGAEVNPIEQTKQILSIVHDKEAR